MEVDVWPEDIADAWERSSGCRGHLWHNPLAIALARTLGLYAVVSETRAHIATVRAQDGLHDLSADARLYMQRWHFGHAEAVRVRLW